MFQRVAEQIKRSTSSDLTELLTLFLAKGSVLEATGVQTDQGSVFGVSETTVRTRCIWTCHPCHNRVPECVYSDRTLRVEANFYKLAVPAQSGERGNKWNGAGSMGVAS